MLRAEAFCGLRPEAFCGLTLTPAAPLGSKNFFTLLRRNTTPPLGAGDGAAHGDDAQLGVHLDHVQVHDGDLLVAHLAGADLALEDAGRIAVGAHGAGVADHRTGAVGLLQTVSAVALDDALVAVALADAGHVHAVALGEHVPTFTSSPTFISAALASLNSFRVFLRASPAFFRWPSSGLVSLRSATSP